MIIAIILINFIKIFNEGPAVSFKRKDYIQGLLIL